MKAIAIVLILFASLTVVGSSATNDFVVVTNDWYQGNFSNVLSYARQRMAINTNDIVAANIMVDYDVAFSSKVSISNSIDRLLACENMITNAKYRAISDIMRPYWIVYQRQKLPSFTQADLAERNEKAKRPGREMVSSYMLRLLWDEGLW